MARTALLASLVALAGCHGLFGGRTTDRDKDINSFAQARQRAATYYDGRDYFRAAAQYRKALEVRPDHLHTKFGYAYSLMYTDLPRNLLTARDTLRRIGELRNEKEEVKRIYGLAMVNRNLATHYFRRSRKYRDEGRIKAADQDQATARSYAGESIDHWKTVIEVDRELAEKKIAAVQRVSASLRPDAHVGIAHCEIMLGDAQHLDHFERAEANIKIFAEMARNARRFWHSKRDQTLVADPMRDAEEGTFGGVNEDREQRLRYEARIARTILEEVAVRRALLDTYLFLNRYDDAIAQCDEILALDPSVDEVLLFRARAYEFKKPPNLRAALRDMKAYRARQKLDVLTDKLIRINRHIKRYEEKIALENGRAGG